MGPTDHDDGLQTIGVAFRAQSLVDKPWIDSTNCLVIDDLRPDEEDVSSIQCDRMPRRLTVSSHVKQNCRDKALFAESDLTQFLFTLSDKSNVGVHIDEHNSSILNVD